MSHNNEITHNLTLTFEQPKLSSEVVVKLESVGKRYGQRWAIQEINLSLYAGEILGFIGPNGAGKTTLMKLIAGLSGVSIGTVTVLGQQLSNNNLRTPEGVGLVLEQIGFIPYLSGFQNLVALARIRNKVNKMTIRSTLQQVGLDPDDRRAVRTYSMGMRQRLGIAQAIMEKPRLLLLDEPTNGLDPAGIISLRQLLRTIASQGTSIFLASHLLTEVERICERVILVKEGKIEREIVTSAPGYAHIRLEVSTKEDVTRLLHWANQSNFKLETPESDTQFVFYLPLSQPVPVLVRQLVLEANINIESVGQIRESLETAFLDLIK